MSSPVLNHWLVYVSMKILNSHITQLHGPSLNRVVILASSILLILEHSFYFWYKEHPGNPLLSALEQYIGSPLPDIVDAAVGKAIKANQDCEFLCNAIIDIAHCLYASSQLKYYNQQIVTSHSSGGFTQ
ncbi:hypothetical protein EDD17DRAFT_1515325 [Pisolithus thermaeus]|nr:hypothetical protein EDD17DRAFT_1515325 [Pisolithus thermaeus]